MRRCFDFHVDSRAVWPLFMGALEIRALKDGFVSSVCLVIAEAEACKGSEEYKVKVPVMVNSRKIFDII